MVPLELYGQLCITAGVARKMKLTARRKKANVNWVRCLKLHATLKTELAQELQKLLPKNKFKVALRDAAPVGESSAVRAAHSLLNYNPTVFASNTLITKEAVMYAVYTAHKREEGGEKLKKWHALVNQLSK